MDESTLSATLPIVTIAIPTLNRAAYLRHALDSALAQTYQRIEVVVSNNASIDETATYLRSITDRRLRVLEQTSGLSMIDNWNACVACSSGSYFLLLSDDDVLEPTAIEDLLSGYIVATHSSSVPGIVYCGGWIINSTGIVIRRMTPSPDVEAAVDLIKHFLYGERDLWFCGILFRRSDVGNGFPLTFNVSSDSALWIQAVIRHGSARYIAKDLVRYRIHEGATSTTSVDDWKQDICQLGDMAIAELRVRNELTQEVDDEIRRAIRRLNTRMIPGRINQGLGANRLRALREYCRHLSSFMSFDGIVILTRGIISLMLPKKAKHWMRMRKANMSRKTF